MADPTIEFDHVFFSYGSGSVLKDVSFRVDSNEFIGIIGPNGGGKTTLLKLMLRFLKPTTGRIHMPKSFSVHSQLAYVPQGLRCDRQFPISVMELVLSGRLYCLPWYGIYREQDYEAARDALKKVDMFEYKDRPFGTLSGGQAQRALIARALVSDPKLLLLDEPTASVDAQAEADIYRILGELRGKMTILMVTHDLKAVIELVDRVLCVQSGVITMRPEEVCQHFAIGLYHPPIQLQKQSNPSVAP